MTIIEAINRVDALKPNNYDQKTKISWLSTIDGMIKSEIIDTHEGAESVTFTGYDSDTPTTTELLVPTPYEDIYVRWLEAQIDYNNGEYGRYSNSMTMYNAAYSAYERYYNRNHMPLGQSFKYF
ncbi:MAG: hypothetical protein IJO75_01710 [Clostridia bacterium]|nr:hypothetical protein [Clostridia bacterium]